MILTAEDISAIKVAVVDELEPRFDKMNGRFTKIEGQISDLAHLSNKRFTAIELRLDAIESKLQQIAAFVPYENAFLIPPIRKQKQD